MSCMGVEAKLPCVAATVLGMYAKCAYPRTSGCLCFSLMGPYALVGAICPFCDHGLVRSLT
jgi:hypothetical protein